MPLVRRAAACVDRRPPVTPLAAHAREGQAGRATPDRLACCSTMMTSAAAASDGLADGMASMASAGGAR